MSGHTATHAPAENRLLAALPREEYGRLLPRLEPVHLSQGQILYEVGDAARHAYFLFSGMVSLLSTTEDGETIEAAVVGDEGMVGIPIILKSNKTPYRVVAQFSGDAVRVRAGVIEREFGRGGELQDLLLRYTYAVITQISRSAACNHFHPVKERVCRWLLTSCECVRSDALPLTQESLANLIGAPRTGVTSTIGRLQAEGLIHCTRGKIQILDRDGLESSACNCYEIFRQEIGRLY